MQLDASLSWLALALTPGLAARLSGRLLRRFGSPEGVFRASRADLESCKQRLPVISSRLSGGQTFVRVASEVEPEAGFHVVEPELEDVYFSALHRPVMAGVGAAG